MTTDLENLVRLVWACGPVCLIWRKGVNTAEPGQMAAMTESIKNGGKKGAGSLIIGTFRS